MKQLRMKRWTRARLNFEGSLYREPCPVCGAEPFTWCRTKNGGRTHTHSERHGRGAPPVKRGPYAPREVSP